MFSFIMWFGLALFCQISILRIWLDGEIFAEVQEYILGKTSSKNFFVRKFAYLLSCWQCLGVWVAWGILALFSLVPEVPSSMKLWYVILLLGFAISLISELFYSFVLIHLDRFAGIPDPDDLVIEPTLDIIKDLQQESPVSRAERQEESKNVEETDERIEENSSVDTDSTGV